jgi:signal transduction histidine kinase
VRRLDASVSDALRLARSGHLSPVTLDLRQSLEAAYRAAEPRFASRGAQLQTLALPSEPVRIKGDPGALEQLFLNLLLNAADALSMGEQAGIEFKQEAGRVGISIWDRGKGIVPDAMDQIFEPFYSTTPEGTGLGLPIARRIAQAHGGELKIESTPGECTTARVSLPVESTASADRA